MTRKTSKSYTAVFEFIENKLFKLQPAKFMTDYEDGMRLAIRTHWPNAEIHGCWFHLIRAVIRRANKSGMKHLLMYNDNAKIIMKGLISIPLLPAHRIQEGYECILQFTRKKKLQKRFTHLLAYFSRYWLNNQVGFFFDLSCQLVIINETCHNF